MTGFLGQSAMGVYLLCVFWLLTVSTIVRVSEAKVETELESSLKIAPDYPDESHKVEGNKTERYKLVSFKFHHVEVPYVICLWILLASIAKIGFHLYDKLPHIFPESCVLIVMGILVGVTLYYTETADATQYSLDAKSFFLFLLPPIIYDAGYHMPNRAFFNNIGTILLLAVVNTLWNTVGIGLGLWGMSYLGWIHRPISILHAFVFSALISAVDPVAVLAIFEEIQVNEILYILVFGESLLNDGVTVVLYHMMEGFTEIGESNLEVIDFVTGVASFFIVVIGGTLIGVIYGLVGAFITKYTDHVRVIEPIFIFVLGYLAYLTAESMELSGILALTFGGIIMRHYTEANMAKKSTTTVKYFMKMMASVSETIIFMFLGLSTVIDSHEWYLDFILFTILFCLIFRVTGVIFLSFMVNRRRLIRLSAIDQFIMSYGGLRGGIAFCLALLLNQHHIPEKAMFVTTTMVIVFFTVFVQGITIKPVVSALKVERAEEKEPSMNEIFHRRVLDHLMAGIEDIVGKSGHNSLHHKFEYYNNRYLKPWLLREKPKTRDTSIIRVFTKLNMQDAKATAKAFPGSMSRDASWSQFNMPAQSPSMSSLNNRRATVAVPNDHESEIIINMHGLDPTSLKQMPDDLVMHRVLEDSMVSPRSSWTQERRHTLAEIHNPHNPPFHHPSEQDQLRHLFGNGGVYTPITKDVTTTVTSPSPRLANGGGRKVRKNVSFSAAHGRLGKKLSDVLEQSFAQENGQQSEEVPDIPEVTFTLGEFSPPVQSPDPYKENPLAQATAVTSTHSPPTSHDTHHQSSNMSPSSSSPPSSPSDPSPSTEPGQGSTTTSQQPQQVHQPDSNISSSSSSSQTPSSSSTKSPTTAAASTTGSHTNNDPDHLQPRPLTPTTTVNVYTAIVEVDKDKNKSALDIPQPFSQLAISSDIPLPIPPFTKADSPFYDDIDNIKHHNSSSKATTTIRCDDSGQGSSSPICDDRDLKSELSTDVEYPSQPPLTEQTLAESSLPWRRQTSSLPPVPSSVSLSLPDDENPLMSEAPSWADNLAYNHLTESGSPYHSPYNTLTGTNPSPPPPRPVFDLFPPSSPSPDEDHHDHIATIPPPPWKDEDSGHIDEEPLPSQSAMAARQGGGDKASCFLVSSHDLVPPSHHSCIEFHPHVLDGACGGVSRLKRVSSLASSPIHFQLMDKPDAMTTNVIESELIGMESDYHHEMRDRVSKWLALSPPSSVGIDGNGGAGEDRTLSPEGEMILESLRKKKEQWDAEETPSGTDADVEESDFENENEDGDFDTKL